MARIAPFSFTGFAWQMPLPLLNRFLQRIDTLYDYIPVHSTQLQLAFLTIFRVVAGGFHFARSTFFALGATKTGCYFQNLLTIHNIINMNYYYYINSDLTCQSGSKMFLRAGVSGMFYGACIFFFPAP